MKNWVLATVLGAVTMAGVAALAHPPTIAAQVTPPAGVQKDGPFRLLLAARADAQHRRAQGFRTEVTQENGVWWVVYYP